MPGVLIWRSRNLVDWQPVRSALHEYGGSISAPELTRYEGRLYIYYETAGGNHVIVDDRIEGPWSGRTKLDLPHIDPGHIATPQGQRIPARLRRATRSSWRPFGGVSMECVLCWVCFWVLCYMFCYVVYLFLLLFSLLLCMFAFVSVCFVHADNFGKVFEAWPIPEAGTSSASVWNRQSSSIAMDTTTSWSPRAAPPDPRQGT